MGTAEILIVFSALMALIALVTIGIDWIGKPLKNRRFIPRIYRFDDEKLPTDRYGHISLDPAPDQLPLQQPATQPPAVAATAAVSPPARRNQPAPRTVARIAPSGEGSAFSDSLAPAAATGAASAAAAARSTIAGTREVAPVNPSGSWNPGMALDATVQDRKPSLAVKAERFWKSTAAELTGHGDNGAGHFTAEDLERMAAGKAPRRLNPRTSRTESMQLTGLRRASSRSDVRMRWPDESVDPWSAS